MGRGLVTLILFGLAACTVELEPDPLASLADAAPDPSAPPDSGVAALATRPDRVDFGRVRGGGEAAEIIEISNVGRAPIDALTVQVEGGSPFTARLWDTTPLRPGERRAVEVRYAPRASGAHAAVLVVRDVDHPQTRAEVDLRGGAVFPCAEVSSEAVEVRAGVGNAVTARVQVGPCSVGGLTVRAVSLEDDGGGVFSLLGPPSLPQTLELPDALELSLRFEPLGAEPAGYRGRLRIETDDLADPVREVTLEGRSLANACPEPRINGDGATVRLLDAVLLDATPSVDPEGGPLRYEWTLTDRPLGSRAVILEPPEDPDAPFHPTDSRRFDDPRTPRAVLIADRVGRFVADLRVVDALGAVAPSPACGTEAVRMVVDAGCDCALLISADWERDAFVAPETAPADIDLRLAHSHAASWDEIAWVCSAANPTPLWGARLLVDDRDRGPEHIAFEAPEDAGEAGVWRVAAQWARGGAAGNTAFTRVSVYFDSELVWSDDRTLEAAGAFWDVAAIVWSEAAGKRVIPIGQVRRQMPETIMPLP